VPAAGGVQGPGVTAKEIFIGIAYTANGDQANAAIGAAISRGDERKNAQAVIDQINERGGVAGRKLKPVFYAYDAQSTETSASQDQGACAAFTEDNKVFAVASGGLTETFNGCMQKAGVLRSRPGSSSTPTGLLRPVPDVLQRRHDEPGTG
jgi:ABC-type branched-subunit amino acid transport system substrate-binding protein